MAQNFRLNRREWLRLASVGVGAGSMCGWMDALAFDAAAHPARNKSVIMLWMAGGPATIDLWDLKPGHENGGLFKPIDTAAAGIQISEHLPKLASWTKEMVLVRSMTSKEGDHGRATEFVKTGYLPQGAIQFPALGALVAHELLPAEADLPGFVSIGTSRRSETLGGGFLGPRYSPLAIAEGAAGNNGTEGPAGPDALRVPNLGRPAGVSEAAYAERLRLLDHIETGYLADDATARWLPACNRPRPAPCG